MTQEYKTLSELDVKPGDVVESMAGSQNTIKTMTTDTVIDTYDIEWSNRNPIWRIVSRASDTPKPLRDMTDAEIGALVRAKNEGKVIEIWDYDEWLEAEPAWDATNAYRVRPEPKRETVTLYWRKGNPAHNIEHGDTHRITFDLIDGKPDCDSIKMEEL